jgi:hypothetical protein
MSHDQSAYGLWFLVAINSAIFIMFTYSFFKPATARDWRTFGAFSAFIVALFVEMYGFPLTIYVLSGWLQTRYPGLDLLSHNAGHLWSTLLGEKGNPHFGILHIASYVALACGFLPALQRLAGPVPRPTPEYAGDCRSLFSHPASAVRGVRADPAGLPVSLADVVDSAHVPGPGGHVWTPDGH